MKYLSIAFIVTLLIQGCSMIDDVNRPVSKEKFTDVLFDIHMADAILNDLRLYDYNLDTSELSFYNHVWKKHDFSAAEFEEALNYYSKNAKELNEIYDEVILRINQKKENLVDLNDTSDVHSNYTMDLWSMRQSYSIPEDGGDQYTIPFKISTSTHGTYTLTADIRYFENDSSVRPRMTILAYYSDETFDIGKDFNVKKDGIWYSFKAKVVTNREKKLDRVSGWVLDHSKVNGGKHADVKNIKLVLDTHR